MPKPILYGIIMGPPTRAVLLAANAIGLDFEYRPVDMLAGEHLSEEYLKKNPQHTVPTLEDDSNYIWDSHAIAIYLVEKYGNDKFLYPKDLYKRAQIDQRLHFDSGILYPRMRRLTDAFRSKGTLPDDERNAVLEAYEFLEKFLEKDLYLVGNILTLADLCCVATISTLNLAVPIDGSKFPKLTQWLQRMSLLPYYERANGEGIKKVLDAFITK